MRQPILLLLAGTLVALGGCRRDLGECNLDNPVVGPAAFDVAYRESDGLPMYTGQAIYQTSCGNSQFCHSPNAVGGDRFGAPAGLNFDVMLACTDLDSGCDTTDCRMTSDSPICDSFVRLEQNANRAFGDGGISIAQIRTGSMPPGAAGRAAKSNDAFLNSNNTPDNTGDDTVLPGVETPDGEEIVRNWLACGAPVVSRTDAPASPANQLRPCPPTNGEEVCIFRGPSLVPEPTWSSIYQITIFSQCLRCHAPANGNMDQNPDNLGGTIPGGASPEGLLALNMSGSNLNDTSGWAAEAYDRVVNAVASAAGACSGFGTLVVPSDAANSIMHQKIVGTQLCGDTMPLDGALLSPTVAGVIEDWINAGAPNN